MPARKGFTLLEVLLVIVVMGIVFSLAFPSSQMFASLELRRWTRHLVSDLRWAQHRAVSKNENHYIEIDAENNKYRIYLVRQEQEEELRSRQLKPPVELAGISTAAPRFHFTPSGAPSRGNTIFLECQGRRAFIYTRVGTGRVRFEYD